MKLRNSLGRNRYRKLNKKNNNKNQKRIYMIIGYYKNVKEN